MFDFHLERRTVSLIFECIDLLQDEVLIFQSLVQKTPPPTSSHNNKMGKRK